MLSITQNRTISLAIKDLKVTHTHVPAAATPVPPSTRWKTRDYQTKKSSLESKALETKNQGYIKPLHCFQHHPGSGLYHQTERK